MLTLSLLRHAKSAWDEPSLEDHERALAPRGIKAARDMGKFLAEEKLRPDLILCSGAVRARATLALILSEIGASGIDIAYNDSIYLAHPATMIEIVRKVANGPKHVMLIGHNPGLHAMALELTGSGNRRVIAELAAKFPTAALAVISFNAAHWNEVRPGSGRLDRFTTPRGLKV
jgi:phosphohistidine phosphatase